MLLPRITGVVILLTLASLQVRAADWPQFLGPHRNGISSETKLLQSWPQGGVQEVWRVRGGVGMSAVSIANGKAYTMVQDATNQILLALDAKTGKELWRTEIAPAYENGQGNGPRATPTIDEGIAYVFTGEGVLAAVDISNGDVKWKVNTVKQLRGKVAEFGMASSPLVLDKIVVVHTGCPRAAVAAFTKQDGGFFWQAGDGAAGYASPTLLKLNGESQVVAFTGASAYGVDPSSGKVAWRFPFETDFACNTATPFAVDGNVLLSAGENHGSVLIKPSSNPRVVWESLGRTSKLRNEWQTSALIDGYLYGFDNVGSAGPVSHLTCVNANTGEQVWQEKRFGKGNLIAADGKLFIINVKGELVVVNANPKQYQELGRQNACEFTRQSPSLANGMLYLRDDKEIICLDVRAK